VPATMLAHLHDAPPPSSERGAPREFDRVIARALAKAPEDRYPSAGDLGRAALAAARGEPVTESERSVAVGPAAPSEAPTAVVNGGGDGATAVTRWDPFAHGETEATAWDPAAHHDDLGAAEREPAAEPPAGDRAVVRPRRWPYQLAAGLMIFAALVVVGLVLGQVFDDPGGGSASRSGPLSEDEVRSAAEAFASAYADEDPAALRATLARDVVRVLPGGRTEGRNQVVDQYQRQFDGKVGGYDLNDLTVTGGRVGRATGSYHVDRDGGDAYEGAIVFGVIRERGEPRIQLIAARPAT
jgi:ketosteroid isomerase-like protein